MEQRFPEPEERRESSRFISEVLQGCRGAGHRWQHGQEANGMHDPMYDAIATRSIGHLVELLSFVYGMDPPRGDRSCGGGASGWSYRGRLIM